MSYVILLLISNGLFNEEIIFMKLKILNETKNFSYKNSFNHSHLRMMGMAIIFRSIFLMRKLRFSINSRKIGIINF